MNSRNNKVEEYMDAYAECGYFSGSVLVAYKGSILLSKGYGLANIECHTPNSPQTKFRVHSQDHAVDYVAEYINERFTFMKNDSDIVTRVIYTNASGEAALYERSI